MPPRKGWAAVYCRLSKEDEEKTARESESIRNQRALLLAWAADHGYRIYRVYTDEDYSGIDRARPGFNAMLADARAGKFEVILAKTQSRFTRDMELVEKYLHGLFPEWGVRFIAVLDHVDTCDPAGKKARQINGLINEWYLEDLSGNVRAVLDHKRRSGSYIASFALYGLIRKLAPLGSLEGMALENVILAPFALGYMFWLLERGELLFATEGWDVKTLLLLAGPITTIPLLLFASGVRRIPYSTVGIIQYVSPTIVFLLGRFAFGEPFSVEMMTGFVLIWTAVVVFTVDTVRTTARLRREINRRAAEDS